MKKILSCFLAFLFAFAIGFTLPVFANDTEGASKVSKLVVAQTEPATQTAPSETISEHGKVHVSDDNFIPISSVGVTKKIETALQPQPQPEIVPLR